MVGYAVRARDRWRPHQSVDVSLEASALTLAVVGKTLFGADVESLSAEIREALMAASDTLDPLVSLLAPARRVRPQRERLARVIDDLIVQHQRSRSDHGNLISLLLASQDGGPDTISNQARDDALTILLAGHDTIATALVWAWILLAQHPEARARMEHEVHTCVGTRSATAADVSRLTFTRAVLSESLRLRPPAWVVARSAIVDFEMGDVHLPAGAVVIISQYVMHRDERFYPNPTAFEPARWLDDGQVGRPKFAYIPFGAGPRACIGEGFAWMEGVLLLATFAQRWRLELLGQEALQPRPTITLRPRANVRMMAHPL
jgi:cytochrome P450